MGKESGLALSRSCLHVRYSHAPNLVAQRWWIGATVPRINGKQAHSISSAVAVTGEVTTGSGDDSGIVSWTAIPSAPTVNGWRRPMSTTSRNCGITPNFG